LEKFFFQFYCISPSYVEERIFFLHTALCCTL